MLESFQFVQGQPYCIFCLYVQVLSKVSKILLDKDLRTIYDEEGSVDEDRDINEQTLKDWTQYWRSMFRVGYGLVVIIS